MKTIRTWWGRKFIEALESFTEPARLARGRGYAHNDRIETWKIYGNRVSATIRGNVNPYYGVYEEPHYQTQIELMAISSSDWTEVIHHLGRRAAFVSRLLLNEVPDSIKEPFEALDLHLLPCNGKDLKTDCSCPDWENPCKHIAGLYYFLAAKLDHDPFLLFELRGLSREELLRRLRDTPLGQVLADALSEEEMPVESVESFFTRPCPQALPARLPPEDFWRPPKRLPDSVEPAVPPAVPALLIKKGGDFPEFWESESSFVETMEAVYEAVRKAVKRW